jgi:hypothetical protein
VVDGKWYVGRDPKPDARTARPESRVANFESRNATAFRIEETNPPSLLESAEV